MEYTIEIQEGYFEKYPTHIEVPEGYWVCSQNVEYTTTGE